jgi:hypothetical protein
MPDCQACGGSGEYQEGAPGWRDVSDYDGKTWRQLQRESRELSEAGLHAELVRIEGRWLEKASRHQKKYHRILSKKPDVQVLMIQLALWELAMSVAIKHSLPADVAPAAALLCRRQKTPFSLPELVEIVRDEETHGVLYLNPIKSITALGDLLIRHNITFKQHADDKFLSLHGSWLGSGEYTDNSGQVVELKEITEAVVMPLRLDQNLVDARPADKVLARVMTPGLWDLLPSLTEVLAAEAALIEAPQKPRSPEAPKDDETAGQSVGLWCWKAPQPEAPQPLWRSRPSGVR